MPSRTGCSSSVGKNVGCLHHCINYRVLNNITMGGKLFSSLCLICYMGQKNVYGTRFAHQIFSRIKDGDGCKTLFNACNGHQQYSIKLFTSILLILKHWLKTALTEDSTESRKRHVCQLLEIELKDVVLRSALTPYSKVFGICLSLLEDFGCFVTCSVLLQNLVFLILNREGLPARTSRSLWDRGIGAVFSLSFFGSCL